MTTPSFEEALVRVLALEGGYSDDPADPGGRTQFGICERDFPEAWAKGPPDLAQARSIYFREFWLPLRCEELVDQAVAEELFEAGVNCGPARAVKWLQLAYNGVRPEGWPDLVVDGRIGPMSLHAVNTLLRQGGAAKTALVIAQNIFQGQHYLYLNRRRFIRGWLSKRVQLHATG